MHKSENEKIDFILDEHERIFRKQGSLCMALGKGFLVIAILCGVATFCVSGLYLKSLCLSVACCCGVFSRIFNYYSVPEESRRVLSRQELLWLMSLTEDCPDMHQELLNCLLSGKKLTGLDRGKSGVSGGKRWMQCRSLPPVSVNRILFGSLLKGINPNENLQCFMTS